MDPRLYNFCCYMDLLQLKTELTFLSQSRSGASPVVLLELRLPAYDQPLSKSAASNFSVFSSSASFECCALRREVSFLDYQQLEWRNRKSELLVESHKECVEWRRGWATSSSGLEGHPNLPC
ncbi:hypothetical protein Pyn_13666 [Prunus yedoensis var. nudiflora]|uniref:Uncharacterized protein n=1 Tax=Prunus yedoensis var. nudiflora TaxID=2094558 RepID=A0A314Z2Z3_PRUYE|nr:hypothetical protein Pyn_13666 [Prunus yedoensis var. nudiflora]